MKIDDALDRFVTQLEADGRSPHTIRQYQRHVRALAAWVGPRRAVGDLDTRTSPATSPRPGPGHGQTAGFGGRRR